MESTRVLIAASLVTSVLLICRPGTCQSPPSNEIDSARVSTSASPVPLEDPTVPDMFFVDAPESELIELSERMASSATSPRLELPSSPIVPAAPVDQERKPRLVREDDGGRSNSYYVLPDGRRTQPMWARAAYSFPIVSATQGISTLDVGTDYMNPQSGGNEPVMFWNGQQYISGHVGYDYAPTIMWDDGKYKMWWCADGSINGDRIFYAETTGADPNNPLKYWSTPSYVFLPSRFVWDAQQQAWPTPGAIPAAQTSPEAALGS